jgi:hypothetical protein
MEEASLETLQSEFLILKEAYIKLLNDVDVLERWGKPQLEALYITRIGHWQIERLKAQLQVRALQRKIELAMIAVNHDEVPDVIGIELQVASELAEAEQRIMQESHNLAIAKDLLSHLASPEKSAELRSLYKKMAKALHPDVQPNLTDEQRELWLKVQEAYNNGDLDRLKALGLVYAELLEAAETAGQALTANELSLQCATLKEGIRVLEEKIKLLRDAFPFTFEELLKDDEWVAEQTATVQAELEQLRVYEGELRLEYENIIKAYE